MTLLGYDDRAYLFAEYDERYTLGNPTSPLLTLNAADPAGCLWAADEPDGWDAPEVTLPVDGRPDGDGGFAGLPTLEPRTLTVEGSVTAPTRAALRDARARFLAAINSAGASPVRYTHLDDEPAKGLWVHLTGHPRFRALDDRYAEFACVLIAPNPIKTGDAATYGPVRLPTEGNEGGYAQPMTAADGGYVTAGATGQNLVAAVANPGDYPAHARYTIRGPVPDPVVTLTSGQTAGIRGWLSADDVLVIDTETGTVTINGANRYDAWLSGSTFPLIPGTRLDPATGLYTPGGTEVRLRSATGGRDPNASLTVQTAPAWR